MYLGRTLNSIEHFIAIQTVVVSNCIGMDNISDGISKKQSMNRVKKCESLRKLRKDSDGFTLVDLLITVSILGMLASIAIPNYQLMVQSAQMASLESTVFSTQIFATTYFNEYNSYPGSWQGWNGLYIIAQVNSGAYTPCTTFTTPGSQDFCNYMPQLSLPPTLPICISSGVWAVPTLIYMSTGSHYKIMGQCAVSEWANLSNQFSDPARPGWAISVSDDPVATALW